MARIATYLALAAILLHANGCRPKPVSPSDIVVRNTVANQLLQVFAYLEQTAFDANRAGNNYEIQKGVFKVAAEKGWPFFWCIDSNSWFVVNGASDIWKNGTLHSNEIAAYWPRRIKESTKDPMLMAIRFDAKLISIKEEPNITQLHVEDLYDQWKKEH